MELQNNGPFYLSVITNSSSDILYEKELMGINTNNNLMKKVIENSPLSGINKKINHSAKKTLVKMLKQNKTRKSEITSVTGPNTEYDNGGEEQQKTISLATDNHEPKRSKISSNHFVCPCNRCIQNPCFRFFPNQNPTTLASPFPQSIIVQFP